MWKRAHRKEGGALFTNTKSQRNEVWEDAGASAAQLSSRHTLHELRVIDGRAVRKNDRYRVVLTLKLSTENNPVQADDRQTRKVGRLIPQKLEVTDKELETRGRASSCQLDRPGFGPESIQVIYPDVIGTPHA